jgi:hypothetical protein
MSDQVTNEGAVLDHSQVGVLEIVRRSPILTSKELLRRIVSLLFILVAGLLTVFAYYACSLCITVVLAAFPAILVDPPVVILEKLRLPQGRIGDHFTKLCETVLRGFHLHFIIFL